MMITLYCSGPLFGLPDPSPFVVKAELLLKMANISYQRAKMSFGKAPKGKIPYIEDGGQLLGDSHFILQHLMQRHGADFSGGYDERQLAIGWSVSRMMEEHFYFLNVHERWIDDENFNNGPRHFFNMAPAPVRPVVKAIIRRKVAQMLKSQGLGRHTDHERATLAAGDVAAVMAIMGDRPYLLGERISAADASVFPFLWSASAPLFKGKIGDAVRSNTGAMAYVERLARQFFPEFAA